MAPGGGPAPYRAASTRGRPAPRMKTVPTIELLCVPAAPAHPRQRLTGAWPRTALQLTC